MRLIVSSRRSYNTMGKQLSVRIDDDLEDCIEKEREISPYNPDDSEIVRAALREYLPNHEAE